MRAGHGFSLAELLIAVAIAAICLALGVPGFLALQRSVRLDTTFHTLTASIASARATAVMRRTPVSICPSANGRHCDKTVEWEHGWIVYLDPSRSESPRAPEHVLRVHQALPQVVVRASTGRYRVRYQPNGLASGTNLSLRVCSKVELRLEGTIVVSNTGRARRERVRKPTPCPG